MDRWRREAVAAPAGDRLVAPPVLRRAGATCSRRWPPTIADEPLADGMPREELRERLFVGRGPGRLRAGARRPGVRGPPGRARSRGSGHAPGGSVRRRSRRCGRPSGRFADAGLRPPEPSSLGPALGLAPDIVDRVVKLLLRQKVLARVDTLVFHEQALQRLKADVARTQGAARRSGGVSRRCDVQGPVRRDAQVRDPAARVPGSGTCHEAGRETRVIL